MSTLVPTLCWVPKGVCKEDPDKVELSQQEVQRLLREANEQFDVLQLDEECGQSEEGGVKMKVAGELMEGEGEGENIEELYDMEHYDSESDGEGQKVSGAGMGNNMAGLTFYPSNDADPYITLKDMPAEEEDEDDYKILPTDNLLVVGRAEEDFSSVEVHVYSNEDDHSYSHHEILLTAFPLALEWLDYDPEQPDQKGNYMAMGNMTPVIEVWDLDTIDVLEPVFCLGDPAIVSGVAKLSKKGSTETDKKKSKGKKKKSAAKSEAMPTAMIEGHTHSVLGLSWNKVIRNVLASASADCTVRVWDMAWPKSILTLKHPDKVQCCLWHPYQPEVLATGAYDGIVRLFHCKSSECAVRQWKLGAEVERVVWNHFKPEQLLASSEEKTVWCFNKDDGSTVFQIHAHDSAITDMTLSCYMPGLLVTASTDDTIKFWDIHDDKPAFLFSRDMHMGAVMCAKFCVDSPYSLAVGGSKNGFHIIDVQKLLPVAQRFKKRDLLVPVTKSPSDHTKSNGASKDTPTVCENKLEEESEGMEVDGELKDVASADDEDSEVRTKSKVVKSKASSKKRKKNLKSKKKVHH